MKKILQINSVVNYGSTGHIVEDLGNLVQQNGWESYVIYGRKKHASNQNCIYVGNKISFLMNVIFNSITDKHSFYSFFATKKIIKQIDKIKPDIIHLHNIHGYYLNIRLLFKYLKKIDIPIVWTLHDCWAYTGHCSNYTYVKCNKWKKLCNSCSQKHTYPPSFLLDNSKNNFNLKKDLFCSLNNIQIVTPSKWLCNEVKQSFLRKYNIQFIYNGVDLSIFHPSLHNPYTALINKKVILSVANVWDERKGYNDLIKLNSILDHEKYQIVMIGLSKKQIKLLPKEIVGISRTESQQKLVDYYTFADVYFSASVEETLGMTTIEAQACGTPCVVYNSTAIPETIINTETGIVINSGDVKTVYEVIKEITKKPKEIYSKKCIAWVNKNFDKNKNYKKYLELYKNLI